MDFLGFFGRRKPIGQNVSAGAPGLYGTPPIAPPNGTGSPTDNWYDPLPAAQSKPSKAAQILGVIGDAMQTWGGGQATFVPQLLDMRERTDAERRQLEMYKQKREDDWSDFQRQRDYEIANPKPANNDTSNDYSFIQEKLGPEVANQYLRNLGDPTVTVPLGDGQFYSGPRSGLGDALGRTGAPPAKPVGKLTIIPGGGVGNGTGGFR